MKGMEGRTKGKDQVSRFHTRQALSMLVVLSVLVSVFFIMLAQQYNLGQTHEKEILLKHFQERVAHLDNLLARVTEHVDGMRLVAEADLLQSRALKAWPQPLEFQDLAEVAGENRYHLDMFKSPIAQEMIGNLTGLGSLQDRGGDFNREIHMALVLNPMFRAVAGAIKNAAWIYYTSRNNFINIYPWVSSKDFKFSEELHTHEFYTLGLPENNPDRKRFWTKVYVDEYGKGLMTTCAAPVYDRDRFLGTVALDLTVDFLNTIVKKFSPKQGVMFLINDRDQLLAHPSLITSHDKRTKTLYETLPEDLRVSIVRLMKIPENDISHMGSFRIIRCRLHQAPWQVVYFEPVQSLGGSLLELIGVGPLAVLAMLLILVVIMLVITQKQFILPSKKFVNYIMARSQRIQTQMDYGIPQVWRPWFAAVENTFNENEKMTQELQRQNEYLEQRVKQRTAELEKEIEDRKQVQETLRKSEERFRDISYSMADWIWEVDRDGRFTFASETVKQILGYEPEELIGKTVFDIMPADEVKSIKEVYKKIVPVKKPIVDLETWNLSKEGKRVCLLTNGVPILDDGGELIGYRGVDKNITDNKIAEQEQRKLEAQLQRAEKMESIGILAGGVAHDLNNILSGIVSYPDLLLMHVPEGNPLRKPLETIKGTGIKAAAIVQDLLTLARRGFAAIDLVNLNQIITEYLNSPEHEKLKSFHPEVQVKTNLEKNLLNIMGSSIHMSKTIMNLVSNAAEAMTGGGQIIISTENRYIDKPLRGYDEVKEGDYVTLTVSDTGVGISPEDKERIFEPFYTKKIMGRSGTGLGMAVVWGVVKDHKGYIDIKSTESVGTAFILYFPATRNKIVQARHGFSIEDYMGNDEFILVVDDVREQTEIAAMILSKLGYKVAAVSSGEEAIEYIKRTKVDLLILDMIMEPGIDGLDAYKRILEINPNQKAIITSGFSETERVKEAQRLGAGKYVKKPYTLEMIGLAVKEEIEKGSSG
ncbi:MAG: PAS domain S-box protein [Thermodesulfobacteriota bacterium]